MAGMSYESVRAGRLNASQRYRIWPGCCGDGRHRSCGSVHNFEYRGGYRWHDRFECHQNHTHGCPTPMPEHTHRLADWCSERTETKQDD